ncbi:MAG: VOC family protein [Gemmatimonadota bacterium]
MRSHLDHLVVACGDLDQGAAWLEQQLGVASQPGGKHALMGTHNRLLKLGARSYLELIAVDPHAAATRPRWFALDDPAIRGRARERPYLLTWVASTTRIVEAVVQLPELGEVISASRSGFAWRITVPDDGRLNFSGVLPTVIEWEGDAHPCDVLVDSGCELLELRLSHPAASSIVPMFRSLRLGGAVELRPGPIELAARVRTPRGEVVLR